VSVIKNRVSAVNQRAGVDVSTCRGD